MKNFDKAFDAAFSMVSLAANRHLINHMRRVIMHLDMDLETAYLWGTLAHLNVIDLLHPQAKIDDVMNPQGMPTGEMKSISLATLSQVSGFPRETVRRKLLGLQEAGKVEQLENGHWIILASGVDENTYAFTKETVQQLLSVANEISEILERSSKK